MEHFVEFENVSKYYQTGSVRIAAADRLNFYVDKASSASSSGRPVQARPRPHPCFHVSTKWTAAPSP